MRMSLLAILIVSSCAGQTKPSTPPPPPPKQPFCSRSLGVVDCWANPAALLDHPDNVADTPDRPTPPPARKNWLGF